MNGRDLGLLFGGFAIGVATGLLFKKKEEPTKEELVKEINEDCNFVVNDTLTAPPDYLENQAKWEAHVDNVMTKFRTKLENRKEPYSVENPPAPFTEEEMQVYARLKNRVGKVQTSNEECAAFLILNEHMNLLNMYKNVL